MPKRRPTIPISHAQKRQAPKSAANAKRLPELVKPDGPGYMPLYCAAQWIATHGGTREINRFDELLWREAYKALLDRIASEDVKVHGMREGAGETVSGMHFASCSVNYPFSDLRSDLVFSKELCLFSRPYLDDEHWRRGFNDSLEDRHGARWRRLMVRKADVARYWPFAEASVTARGNGPPSLAPAAQPVPQQAPPSSSRRGRRARYDWDEAKIVLLDALKQRGDFDETDQENDWNCQARAEGLIRSHFGEKDQRPSASLVRSHVAKIVKEWREDDR